MDDGDGDGDGDGPPGLSLRVEEDPNFGVARQIIGATWVPAAMALRRASVTAYRCIGALASPFSLNVSAPVPISYDFL